MKNYLKEKLLKFPVLAIVLIIAIASCGDSSKWCVGKWTGSMGEHPKVEYHIQIRNDGTCHVNEDWFWGGNWHADFDAEWEPVSDDVIKIFDYDGHIETGSGMKWNYRKVSRWSIYLRKDGAVSNKESALNYPDGHFKKK